MGYVQGKENEKKGKDSFLYSSMLSICFRIKLNEGNPLDYTHKKN